MNKRTVLFVDDEPQILNSCRRMLYPLYDDWNMLYVESGAKALEVMQNTEITVLITDMRMPGLNGFELIDIVRKKFPDVVRIMLTGQPDKELYCDVIGICHYFLWKPTSFEIFEEVLNRIRELDTALQDEKLFILIAGITSLPSLPSLYVRLTDLLKQPDVSSAAFAGVIRNDMAMTTQLLKLTNSAFFGLAKPLSNLENAITYLGMNVVQNLVLMQQLFTQFSLAEQKEFDLDQLWQHSFCVASMTEKIMKTQSKMDMSYCCRSYLAGLLLNIGKLIFIRHFPEDYRKVLEETALGTRPQSEIEKEHLGIDHAAIGGYLAALWGLPREIVEAISLHHKAPVFSGTSPVMEAVWHANRICQGDFSLSDSNYAAYSLGKQFVSMNNILTLPE